MITIEQYFHDPKAGEQKPHTEAQSAAAQDLLDRVELLCGRAVSDKAFEWTVDPDTGCEISGARGGSGDGGFRTQGSTTGAPHSSHKEARAVDVYDPEGRLDEWLTTFDYGEGGNSMLQAYNLYREAPSATPGWCHLTTRPSASGRRTFNP